MNFDLSRAKLSSKRVSVEWPSHKRITTSIRIARWLHGGSWKEWVLTNEEDAD